MNNSDSETIIPESTQRYLNALFLAKIADEERQKHIESGKIVLMGQYVPMVHRDREGKLLDITEQFAEPFLQYVERAVHHKDGRMLSAEGVLSREELFHICLPQRMLTFREYMTLLEYNSDSLYELEKPISKSEYMVGKGGNKSFNTPKPQSPIRAYYQDQYDYAQAMQEYKQRLRSWEVDKRNFEDFQKSEKLRAEQNYYSYVKRMQNTKHLPEKLIRSLAFQFVCTKYNNYEDFLDTNEPTLNGYIRFLGKVSRTIPILRPWYVKQMCYIPISLIQKHLYITGSTGSGKSELLKFLLHQIIANKKKPRVPRSVVVIEPDGDMTRELAKHKNLPKEDLFYFSTSLDPKPVEDGKHLPHYNPFEFSHTGEQEIDDYAQFLTNAFQELLGEFTGQMELICKSCFHVLLRKKNATFEDFEILLDDNRNEQLVELGKRCPVKPVSDFFKYKFDQKNYSPTRNSISSKISSLLMNTTFARVVSAPKSTFDLEHLANNGGVCLFSMEGLGQDGGSTLGRLLIARLRHIAFSRKQPKGLRPETFLIVDEFQEYVGDSVEIILKQGRKFRLSLVLASQFTGQGLSSDMLKAVLSCTNTKIAGINDEKNFSSIQKTLNIKFQEFEKLETGEFYFKSSQLYTKQSQACKIYIPDWHTDNKGEMKEKAWKEVVQKQQEKFYLSSKEKPEYTKKPRLKKQTSMKSNFKYESF